MDFYAASSWQPDSRGNKAKKLSSSAPTHPSFILDQSESLTKALRDAFSEIAQLKAACASEAAKNAKMKSELRETLNKTQPVSVSVSSVKTLEDRCKSLSAWAEQHRLANVKHEQTIKKHEEMARGLEMALKNVDSAYTKLKAHNSSLVEQLNSTCQVQAELAHVKQENLRLQSDCLKANHRHSTLLASAPVNPELLKKACKVLTSATEILTMASSSPAEPHVIKSYMSEVGVALKDLGTELKEHEDEARGWVTK
jgi:chromosome segregation ATPase